MKKILSAALCAAMILSMASVSYADNTNTKPVQTAQTEHTISVIPKPVKPIIAVSQPELPEDMEEQYQYIQENQTPAAFVESMQKFGAKTSSMLLNQGTVNQTYSPISFAYALGILGSGTKGTTSKEIAKVLESENMSSVSEGLNKFYKSNYSEKEDSILKIANSLWMQKDYTFKSSFAENAADKFYASSYSVDFKKQTAADAMAKWISEQTGGLLNPTFEANPDQVLSIINTLYFEGAWANNFKAENNTTEKFTLADGTQIDTTYMNQEFKGASYYDTDEYTMFEVPFAGGQTMNFVLPKEGAALESLLDEDSMQKILSRQDDASVKYADVNLKLPKFSFDTEFDLNQTCKDLGLEELFTGEADLSGITDGDVAVSDVKQESHIEIDENGCKAAAYTKMDIMKMSMPVDMENYDFNLDRPFLFVIESQDNTPLFVGTVYNPTK